MFPAISSRCSMNEELSKVTTEASSACIAEDDEDSVFQHDTSTFGYAVPTGNKRSGRIGVCVKGTRYPVVAEVAMDMGFQILRQKDAWSLYWGDSWDGVCHIRPKPFQKINHFPGMSAICRKDQLGNNLSRLQRNFPTEFAFFPKTWVLPADRGIVLAHQRECTQKQHVPTYIYKPENSSQGRGITLIRSDKKLLGLTHGIVQEYVPQPLLIDGHKTDFRLYALVTTCVPEFRIFVFADGLVRLASEPYVAPNAHNLGDVFRHLTNYSLNKRSVSFDGSAGDGEGHKRKLSWALQWMTTQGIDTAAVMRAIDDIVVKTILSTESAVKHGYQSLFPTRTTSSACFMLLGFDILLDTTLKPWLLEVNMSPSFTCGAQLDADIKTALIRDTLHLVQLDTHEPTRERRARLQKRRKQTYGKRKTSTETNAKDRRVGTTNVSGLSCKTPFGDTSHAAQPASDTHPQRLKDHEDEVLNNGSGFRRLFPTYDDDRDAAYRRYAADKPSLQRQTVAQEARAQECLEQRARVLEKEKARYDRTLAEERRKAKGRRAKSRQAPGLSPPAAPRPTAERPRPVGIPQRLPRDRPSGQHPLCVPTVSPPSIPARTHRAAGSAVNIVAAPEQPSEELIRFLHDFEARVTPRRASLGCAMGDLSSLCIHPGKAESFQAPVAATEQAPQRISFAKSTSQRGCIGNPGIAHDVHLPAETSPKVSMPTTQLSFDTGRSKDAIREQTSPVPRAQVAQSSTRGRGRRRSKCAMPTVPWAEWIRDATDDVDAILHELRQNFSTVELNTALNKLHHQRRTSHKQRTSAYQPPVVFGLVPPPSPPCPVAEDIGKIPSQGTSTACTRCTTSGTPQRDTFTAGYSEDVAASHTRQKLVGTCHYGYTQPARHRDNDGPTPPWEHLRQTQPPARPASTHPSPRPALPAADADDESSRAVVQECMRLETRRSAGGGVSCVGGATTETNIAGPHPGLSGPPLRVITVHNVKQPPQQPCGPAPPPQTAHAPPPSARANAVVGAVPVRPDPLENPHNSDGAVVCVHPAPLEPVLPHTQPSHAQTFDSLMVPRRSVTPSVQHRSVRHPPGPPPLRL